MDRTGKIIDTSIDFIVYFEICEKDWQRREKFGIKSELTPIDSFLLI
jgi:CRISPR/Cas system-associated endoribonuclease Cas2